MYLTAFRIMYYNRLKYKYHNDTLKYHKRLDECLIFIHEKMLMKKAEN